MCWVGSKTVRRTPTPSASSRNSIGSSNHGSTTMSARHEPPDSSRELGTLEVQGMNDVFYRTARKLRLVQLVSAGYDHVDLDAAQRAGVPVSNNGGANSRAVAEHTILLMLAVYRKLVPQHAMTSGGRWRGNEPIPTFYEMQGKTLGIIGFGTIGKRVARIAAGGFDMRIQYNDVVRMAEHEEDALDVRFRLLPELMRTSDIVTLHVPLTRLTRNMIGARELGYMQPHGVLINCSRG